MKEKTLYKPDDYADALEELGGEATSSTFAEKMDRTPETVARVASSSERIEVTKIENQVNLYRLKDAATSDAQTDEDADSARDEDEAQEGGDG